MMRPLTSLMLPLSLACSGDASATPREKESQVQEDAVEQTEQDEGHQVRKPLPAPEEIAKLPPDGGPEYNRLVFEQSPYLLQHAANPVDWYPWGDEAFAKAKEEDKPVFLSIGYSTCHWCHVMEHESFEDDQVAALMNEHFVCIKVDREERPDIDHIYMQVTQAMTGGGGWPMTVVMTPEKVPFFAGTYFPKESRFGRKGMLELVPILGDLWTNKRDQVLSQAEQVIDFMRRGSASNPGGDMGQEVLDLGLKQLVNNYEPHYGGFGAQAPKFPIPHNHLFLLQMHQRTGDPQPLAMVEYTLEKMRLGGIYDHVGFGFHRYSTDQQWLVPHFEKMLYDQALLTMAYTAAWQITGKPLFRQTAEEILTYVLRDMTSPEGGFYSAEDADSEGEEGLFYLWRTDEVRALLEEADAELFLRVYNVTDEGNFHDEASRSKTGRNIPHLQAPLEEIAAELNMPPKDLRRKLEAIRETLFQEREKRIHPLKDDKILTDWNGLMIAAMARAGQAFDEPRYTEAARRAGDFLLSELRYDDGRLKKLSRLGKSGKMGTLDDYAFATWGLLELYEATFDTRYLTEATALTEKMMAHFSDEESGGFFLSADDVEGLIVRGKEVYDGAVPSGNSVAAWNLLRLARITGDADLEEEAAETMRSFSRTVARSPSAHTQMLAAVDFAVGPSFEIVVAGSPEAEDTRALVAAFRTRYLPHKVLLLRPEGDEPPITAIAPFTADQTSIDGRATAYVCRDFACKEPTTEVEKALGFLDPKEWE